MLFLLALVWKQRGRLKKVPPVWIWSLGRRKLLPKKPKKQLRQKNTGKESGYVRIVGTYTTGYVNRILIKLEEGIFSKPLTFSLDQYFSTTPPIVWSSWNVLWGTRTWIPLPTVLWTSSPIRQKSGWCCRDYSWRWRRTNPNIFFWRCHSNHFVWNLGCRQFVKFCCRL